MAQLLERVGPVIRDPLRTAAAMAAGGGGFVVLNDGRILSDTHGTRASVLIELLEAPHLSEPAYSAIEKVRADLERNPSTDPKQNWDAVLSGAVRHGFVVGSVLTEGGDIAVRIDYSRDSVGYPAMAELDRLCTEFGVTRPGAVQVQFADGKPVPLRSFIGTIRADRVQAMENDSRQSSAVSIRIEPGKPPAPHRGTPGAETPGVG